MIALLGMDSCVQPLTMPKQFSYKVNVSDDMLNMFNLKATYISPTDGKVTAQIKSKSWSTKFYLTGEITPTMVLSMTAKPEAKNGSILVKDRYEMNLYYDIVLNDNESQKVVTRGVSKSASDFTTYEFKVPAGKDPEAVTIEMPGLKYDKHFVFCFTVDDSYENGWSRIFPLFHGRWIDKQEFFHLGLGRTTGYTPDEPLCITDGCGGDRVFTFGEAIWPNCWNASNKNGLIQDRIVSVYNPYISWEELQIMTDLGNAVYWHDVDTTKWNIRNVEDIVKGMKEDYDKTLDKIGYHMKTMAQPNGDKNYMAAAQESPLACLTRATLDFEEVSIPGCKSLYKKNVYGGASPGTYDNKLKELAVQAASDSVMLVSMLEHRPQEGCLNMLREIYSLYGKAGADNIWVTTYDELYEYLERRNSVSFTSKVEDGFVHFTVSVPYEETFEFGELSFIVRGADGPAIRISDNLYGFASVHRNDGTTLVNCNCDERSVTRTEKYVTLYEHTMKSEYKDDAEYLISLLREDLRAPYLKRLEGAHAPTKDEIPINGLYENWQMPYYIELYDGFEDTVVFK